MRSKGLKEAVVYFNLNFVSEILIQGFNFLTSKKRNVRMTKPFCIQGKRIKLQFKFLLCLQKNKLLKGFQKN